MAPPIDHELLEQIYDVPLGKSDWDEVILRIRRICNARIGSLHSFGTGAGEVEQLSLSGDDEASWREYAAHFVPIDPFCEAMRTGVIRPGQVVRDTQLFERKRFERTEFYNDFWRKYRLGYTAGGHHLDAHGHWLQLSLPRPLDAPDYVDRDLIALQLYFRHIARAVELQRALAGRRGVPDLDALARRYRLTAAEIKLLESLIATASLREAANRRHRSYNTLRAQLQSILQKTGTKSQVELISLLHQ
jgi:DNA-binding CsgD family transcriptional regulator